MWCWMRWSLRREVNGLDADGSQGRITFAKNQGWEFSDLARGGGRKACRRVCRTPRRGGLSNRGPATAANKYEVPPHGSSILGPRLRPHSPWTRASHDSRRLSRRWSAPADLRDLAHERSAGRTRDRRAGGRRLAEGRLRLVLPQRDRPGAGHPGGGAWGAGG